MKLDSHRRRDVKNDHDRGEHFNLERLLDGMEIGQEGTEQLLKGEPISGCFQPRSLSEARKLRLRNAGKPRSRGSPVAVRNVEDFHVMEIL